MEKITIKNVISKGLQIPASDQFYNSEPWFLFSKNHLISILRRMYGNREMFDDLIFDESTGHIKPDSDILAETQDTMNLVMQVNTWKYRHLYDIYCAEYNPIWNVDGIEKETIDRLQENTGEQTNEQSGTDTLEMSGKETNTKSGYETNEPSGVSKITKSGSITESNSGGPTNSRTTFDSATFADLDKTTDTGKHSTTYGENISGGSDPYIEQTSYVSREDKLTYHDVKDEKSFDHREDSTTYGKTDTRTDDLTEHENIINIKERHGNIGITTTQKMMNEEISIASSFRFLEIVARDIAVAISYS